MSNNGLMQIVSSNFGLFTDNIKANMNYDLALQGSLSVAGGIFPRYNSGWFSVIIKGTYTSGITSGFPAIPFNISVNNIPMYKILFTPTNPQTSQPIQIFDITNQGLNTQWTGSFSVAFNLSSNSNGQNQMIIYCGTNWIALGAVNAQYQGGYYCVYLY